MSSRLGIAFAICVIALIGASVFGWMLKSQLESDDEAASADPGSSLADALAASTDAFPPFDGFTEAYVLVDDDCLRVVVADEEDERVQGLRGVEALDPYDGMLFVFPEDTDAKFTMADTLIPLDIGWYDATGVPVDRTTMQPCPEDAAECPTYGTNEKYRYALETEPDGGGTGAIGACPA